MTHPDTPDLKPNFEIAIRCNCGAETEPEFLANGQVELYCSEHGLVATVGKPAGG